MLKYNVYGTADKVTKEFVQLHKDHAPISVEKEQRKKPFKTEEEKNLTTHCYRLHTKAAKLFDSCFEAGG